MNKSTYLPLYMGARVQFGPRTRPKTGQLVGRDPRLGWLISTPADIIVPYRYLRAEQLTLLLRPFSDINEKEAYYVRDILQPRLRGLADGALVHNAAAMLEDHQREYKRAAFELGRFLSHHHFDLFNLCTLGMAKDITKVK